jgi:hypothetical protein
MMTQDLALGNGFACLDPHGDLINAVLERVPDSRRADTIVFDPSDEEFPVGFNILSAHSELERMLLSSDLVGIFRRFATSWGDQMNSVLANAVLAFLQSSRGGSLVDLRKFLLDKNFRNTSSLRLLMMTRSVTTGSASSRSSGGNPMHRFLRASTHSCVPG